MPLLESLIGLTQRGGRREPVRDQNSQRGPEIPQFDGSLTADAENTWTPSGAAAPLATASRGTELVLGHKTTALAEVVEGARRQCGNVFCRSVWTPPWKSREQPVFEGRWACSPGCAAALVRSALARETGEWPEDDVPEPHRHRVPLGLVLLAHGWITHAKLQRALEAQRANGFGRIGEWLISEAGVSADEVTRGLSAQWNCPVLTVDGFSPQTTALALPRLFIEEYGALPLRVVGGKVLYVGFRDQLDAAASFAIEQMSGLKTESGVMSETNFRRARERLLDSRFPSLSILEETDRDALGDSVAATIERVRPTASRLLKLHCYYWLRIWSNGAECRPGTTLPMSVDAVTDYLFTIARHPAVGARRWLFQQPDGRKPGGWKADGPQAKESQGDERIDRRTNAHIAVRVAAAELIRSEEPVVSGTPVGVSGRDVPVQAAKSTFDAAAENVKSDHEPVADLDAEPAPVSRVREAALAIVDQSALEAFQAREPARSRHAAWDELFFEERSVPQREPGEKIGRIKPGEVEAGEIEAGGLETIEGEYLPLEPIVDEPVLQDKPAAQSAIGFLFLHRRSDWKQLQAWSQKNLSFLRRGANPASGPDQEG